MRSSSGSTVRRSSCAWPGPSSSSNAPPRLRLERASVEGRRFRIAALCSLAPDLGPEEFEAAIASLERRGLVQPEDEAAGRGRFAHALVPDAAPPGLPRG